MISLRGPLIRVVRLFLLVTLGLTFLSVGAGRVAADWTIDIDAVNNGLGNPATVALGAGSYRAVPYNGTYKAWNANWGLDGWWLSAYYVDSGSNPRRVGGGIYASEAMAFQHALGVSFTLPGPTNVGFSVGDDTYYDNTGGVSLRLTAIPGWIVDINALTNGYDNPVSLSLAAGTYRVTPIDQAHAGYYTAWFAGGSQGEYGWWSAYYLDLPGEGRLVGDGGYDSADEAFRRAVSTTFTLSSPATVNFLIGDSLYTDNAGGVSLWITPVPLPPSVLLFAPVLVGLFGLRRRLKV